MTRPVVADESEWFLTIGPKRGLLHVPVDEIIGYRDLIFMLVLRNFVARYKQTVLGPLWLVLQPLMTTGVFTIVFGRIANLSTDGLPHIVFYLSGVTCWTYFSSTFVATSNTFRENAQLFGKVYFPRLIVPIATMISNGLAFAIQFILLVAVAGYLHVTGNVAGTVFDLSIATTVLPAAVCVLALTGLGLGLMVSATTAKYRDLAYLVGFGTQLLMYATPVIYPLSAVPDRFRLVAQANPVAHAIEAFRQALFGQGQLTIAGLLYALGCSLGILAVGVVAFNRVEQRFIDTV